MRSIESKQDDNDTQGRVSVQLWTVIKWGRKRTSGRVLAGHLLHGYGRLLQSKMRMKWKQLTLSSRPNKCRMPC
jgi:hypothetical protein